MLQYNLPVESVEGMPGVEVTLEGRFVSIICFKCKERKTDNCDQCKISDLQTGM